MSDIHQVRDLLGLRQEDPLTWSGVFCTGKFDELYDYSAGLLEVHIRAIKKRKKDEEDFSFFVRFSLLTVDDGSWGAWDEEPYRTIEEAEARIAQIAKMFQDRIGHSTALPKEKTLNSWLKEVGLWGVYEG